MIRKINKKQSKNKEACEMLATLETLKSKTAMQIAKSKQLIAKAA